MLSLIVSPFYILGNIYVLFRFFHWLESCQEVFKRKRLKLTLAIAYSLLAAAIAIVTFLPANSALRRIVQLIANYWLGVFLYTLLVVIVGHFISLLLRRVFKVLPIDYFMNRRRHILCGIVSLLLIFGVSAYGMYHARDIKLKEYTITVEKDAGGLDHLKVLLISDLHLGYSIGLSQIENGVALINSQKPDLVCLTGDIYDNNFDAIREPDQIADALAGIKSTYGVYACWGNHDVDEKMFVGFAIGGNFKKGHNPNMYKFLDRANIKLLEDEVELIDDKFYVVGRVDATRPETENNARKTPAELLDGLDHTKPIVVLFHEPGELQSLADAGCDLLLSGHTHNGQVFPHTLFIRLAWENPAGLLKKDNMYSIVTSGLGVWGPFMRVGSDAEVVAVDVQFQK